MVNYYVRSSNSEQLKSTELGPQGKDFSEQFDAFFFHDSKGNLLLAGRTTGDDNGIMIAHYEDGKFDKKTTPFSTNMREHFISSSKAAKGGNVDEFRIYRAFANDDGTYEFISGLNTKACFILKVASWRAV